MMTRDNVDITFVHDGKDIDISEAFALLEAMGNDAGELTVATKDGTHHIPIIDSTVRVDKKLVEMRLPTSLGLITVTGHLDLTDDDASQQPDKGAQ